MSTLAVEIGWGWLLALKAVVILAIVPAGALLLGYTFLLKMMSHMQSRLGPMDPGGFHGWFQLIGDGIKFLQKEDIIPDQADRRVFALAPTVVVISTFLIFVVIPVGPNLVVANLDVGIFYALAVSSLSVIGVLMAGFAGLLLGLVHGLICNLPRVNDIAVGIGLMLFGTGLAFLFIGLSRAFSQPQQFRGKVTGPILGALSILIVGFFCFVVLYQTRQLPA